MMKVDSTSFTSANSSFCLAINSMGSLVSNGLKLNLYVSGKVNA